MIDTQSITGASIPRDAFTFLVEDLTCVQVSLDYYRRESAKIIAIFKECLPDGEIGKLSHCVAHYRAPLMLVMSSFY
jgi:hypothetical protein